MKLLTWGLKTFLTNSSNRSCRRWMVKRAQGCSFGPLLTAKETPILQIFPKGIGWGRAALIGTRGTRTPASLDYIERRRNGRRGERRWRSGEWHANKDKGAQTAYLTHKRNCEHCEHPIRMCACVPIQSDALDLHSLAIRRPYCHKLQFSLTCTCLRLLTVTICRLGLDLFPLSQGVTQPVPYCTLFV